MPFAQKYYAVTSLMFFVFGAFIQYSLGSLANIEVFKLFSVTGLVFDIFGFLLLSEIVIKIPAKYEKLLDAVYGTLMLFVFIVPLSISVSGVLAFLIELPSRNIISSFFGGIFTYLAIPLLFLDLGADFFKLKVYTSSTSRIRMMGWFLLLSGLILQLIGSSMDIFT